jgi:hypothetical protein
VRDPAGNNASVAAIGTAQNATTKKATTSQPMHITATSLSSVFTILCAYE